MDKADLHVHTSASDGALSPSEVVKLAFKNGIKAIAITDHDTVDGIEPAMRASEAYGVEIIPGIEINSESDLEDIHILGYYINYKDARLIDFLADLLKKREERAKKIISILWDLGLKISLKEVKEVGGKYIGRPHIARVLLQHGYVSSVKEAFDKYIGRGCPAYVPRSNLSPYDAIQMIKSNGGVAVLAHPGLLKSYDIIGRLKEAGLEGVEAYHTKHTAQQTEEILEIAQAYDLIVTGGSDFHEIDMESNVTIGSTCISCDVIKILKLRSGNNL
ncbi:PHP domain-containing protein [Caldanaerobius polysaccharolyticus]|uniref:PHP domain-containing protein n=1 Tax=Caldanaerobius polysaccharolyticus TaxID=44256 RepID=UPI00047E9E08|nr:PHP domain-containing protein [Caldanaerobius polysaccharolyticus]